MSDLVEFLRVRYDEAEEAARRVHQPYRLYADDNGYIEEPVREERYGEPGYGEYRQYSDGEDVLPNHHNSWALIYNPVDVLADIEAKRRVIAEYESAREYGLLTNDTATLYYVLRLLALPYDQHEDYRQEWKP